MSFHKQIERQLAQDFSPKEETVLIDYNDVVFHGRRLQALEMGRLLTIALRAVANAVKRLIPTDRGSKFANLNEHLRRDIGVSTSNGFGSRGYL